MSRSLSSGRPKAGPVGSMRATSNQAPAGASYTRELLDRGVEYCAKKLGEESIETVLAAVGEDRARLIAEAADLVYHLLVVLKARGIALAEVERALAERTRQTGLQEK